MNDEVFTEDLDVASAQTRNDLAALLRIIHLRADRPSLRSLEARTRHDRTPLSKTVVSEMLRGTRFPRKAVMVSFLRTCGVREEMLEPWRRTWDRVAPSEQDRGSYELPDKPRQMASEVAQVGELAARDRTGEPEAPIAHAPVPRGTVAGPVTPQVRQSRNQTGQRAAGRGGPGPLVRRRELGGRLRTLRVNAGMTIEQVASRLLCSPSKVSRMETGFRSVTLRDIRDLCDLYQVTDISQRDYLMELGREGRRQGWWQTYDVPYGTYIGLEADATSICSHEVTVIPGLLQTADYARAMLQAASPVSDPHRIEQRVTIRLTRQRILSQQDPPHFHVIMDEAALRRIVGHPAVMKAQLHHIVERSSLPNVTIQVIPYDAGAYPALDSSFTILEFPSPMSGMVYLEGTFGFMFVERPQDFERYKNIFRNMQIIAADSRETIALIGKVSKELEKKL